MFAVDGDMGGIVKLVSAEFRAAFHDEIPQFSDIYQNFNTKNSLFCHTFCGIKKASDP